MTENLRQAAKAATAHRIKMLVEAYDALLNNDEACNLAREATKTRPFIYWPADFPGGSDERRDQAIDDLVTAQGAYYAAHNAHTRAWNSRNRV